MWGNDGRFSVSSGMQARCRDIEWVSGGSLAVHYWWTWVKRAFILPILLKKYKLNDPALNQLAVIVRGADTSRLELAPQAPGLMALSLGLSRVFADDHDMLRHGMVMYDALYAWCRDCQKETHGWPPKS